MDANEIAEAAAALRLMLASVDAGELAAPMHWRWYLRGALAALEAVQGLGDVVLDPDKLTADDRLP